MMRKTTKKRAAILSAAVVALFMAAYLAVILFAVAEDAGGEVVAYIVLGIYGLVIVAVILGVLAALRQRLREIDGGEEENAKQY